MRESAGAEPPLVIVKLGGSLVTRKREVEKPRPKLIARLARELTDRGGRRLIVLHGAGSFGHPGAHRFGLARPPAADGRGSAERRRGAAIVMAEVRRLHLMILRALVAAGSSPLSLPIATHAVNRAGRLERLDPEPFRAGLAAGLVPVSFGDVVPDREWGFSILSADDIAAALVPPLRPDRVVFASDVPGILEGPPGRRPAVVPEVTDRVVAALAAPAHGRDVTGGIRKKAEAMRAIAAAGADAALISGLSDGAVSRAIRGEAVYGSWAHARPS
jgi:isopentenyl phosphate kinase